MVFENISLLFLIALSGIFFVILLGAGVLLFGLLENNRALRNENIVLSALFFLVMIVTIVLFKLAAIFNFS